MSWWKNNGDNRLLPAPVALSCQLPQTYEAYNCCTSQSCFFAATNLNLWDGCQSIQSQGEFDPKDAQLVTISVWGCLVPKDVQSERAFNFKNYFCKFWGRHCFIFSDIKNLCQDTSPPSYHWWWKAYESESILQHSLGNGLLLLLVGHIVNRKRPWKNSRSTPRAIDCRNWPNLDTYLPLTKLCFCPAFVRLRG